VGGIGKEEIRYKGVRDYSLFKSNLRNIYIVNATCSCITELYEKWYNFSDFFPNWDFSRDFLYILLTSLEGSAKLRWEVRGARSAPFCVLISLKGGVHAMHERARAAETF
jgi:hypothetical protein